jgi:short-chain fatty acids transporter
LTILTGLAAWGGTEARAVTVLDAWYRGFWLLLEFGMQIVLVLATGYAVALSPLAARGIDRIAARIHRPSRVYLAVLLIGPVLTLVSWGWVVVTAVLARELAARVRGIDYAYLTACVFLSSWSWVCGLSSSIPLLLNTEGNFLVEAGLLPGTIGVEHTLGSTLNFAYLGLFALFIPWVTMALRPRTADAVPLETLRAEPENALTVREAAESSLLPGRALSDVLGHSSWLTGTMVLAGLAYLVRHLALRGLDLDLNLMIFAFLLVGMALHRTPLRYVEAMRRACSNVSGILFQYPFYAGIMGIMMYTGLGAAIAGWIATRAAPESLPVLAQLVGAAVNFAIPSAGGEWAVVGPPLLEAVNTMTVPGTAEHLALVSRVAMAVAYGETSTNLLQPFFLLVILPVMGAGVRLQARDVMGYLAPPFLVFYVVTAVLVTWG